MSLWMVGTLLMLGAAGLLYGYQSRKRGVATLLATETVQVEFLESLAASMREDMGEGSLYYKTEISGVVECDEPLVSDLAGTECVYYSMSIHRKYEETFYETDQQGNRRRRVRSGSEQVAGNERSVRFRVNDGTGVLFVEPGGAEFVAETVLSAFQPAEGGSDRELRIGDRMIRLAQAVLGNDRRTLGYQLEESVIAVGRQVFLLGEVVDDHGTLCMKTPHDDGRFLISTKQEAQLLREGRTQMKWMKFGAMTAVVLGLLLIIINLVKYLGR
ncbi:E3 ubiquitin ligase family protein [bacterium]|nr:E3 ubiquitin ligase family protein [candidate division CSSED10-310 bacterium]